MRLFLDDGRANPADFGSSALLCAAYEGHVKVVKLFLKDGRANPSDCNSDALWVAASCDHYKVVRLLLNNGLANPADLNSAALRYAAGCGHVKVVKLLLEDGRADPTACVPFDANRVEADSGYKSAAVLITADIRMRSRWNIRCDTVFIIIQISLRFDA